MQKFRKDERKIAYFSMEIGIDPSIPNYSGGLGILAGDVVRTCADLQVPMIAVTLLYRKGYFFQKLNEKGQQQELPYEWTLPNTLELLPERVYITISGRGVWLQAWQYTIQGQDGYEVPVIFLDSNVPENNDADRILTDHLYGGDERYRLSQEIILGIGCVRMLRQLGCTRICKYHMNEGHASLLTLN
jgi:starch phosphorylase